MDIDILRESIVEEKYHLYKREMKKCVKNVINDYKKVLKENEQLKEEIEYWKECAEGETGVRQQMQEDYQEQIQELLESE